MSTPALHPLGSIQHRAFLDIDEQASCLEGYDQRYTLVGRGRYSGAFSTALLKGGGLVHLEETNRTLVQQGGVPQRSAGIGFLMSPGGRSTFNGTELDGDTLVLLDAGDSFDAVLGAGSCFCVIETPNSESPTTRADGHPRVIQSAGDSLSRVREWAGRQLQPGTQRNCLPDAVAVVGEAVWHARSTRHPSPAPRLNSADRHRLYRRARDWMETHADASFSISELCRHIGASRRAVEYGFEASIGTSPSAFLKTLRLNRVRRNLMDTPWEGLRIGDVAARWGLWHPSRFAAEYRSLFGELPSQTVQRQGRPGNPTPGRR